MKNDNKINKWFIENKKSLIFGVVGLLIGILLMGMLWPKRIASLKDGTEPVVSIDGSVITADDLYNELKSNGGILALLDIVDNKILDELYDVEDEASEYAKDQAEYYFSIYESYYGYTKEEFLTSNGFQNEETFINFLKDDYVAQKYYKDYLIKQLTDKELESYYKNSVFGDKYVYLFSSEDEDNNLSNVRKDLKDGKDVSEIKKKYKDITVNDYGTITFVTAVDYNTEVVEQIKNLGKGEYSKVLDIEEYGQVVVYVTDAKEKPTYEAALEGIQEALITKMSNEDETLYYKAFIKLRDEHNIKFSDTVLGSEYEKYKKQYK